MLVVTRSKFDFSQLVWPDAFARIDELADPIWVSPSGDFTIWKSSSRAN